MATANPTASRPQRGDATIRRALALLEERLRVPGAALNTPTRVGELLQLKLAEREQEVFAVLFLDAMNRLIEYREVFFGTLTQTSVYPREIVKLALRLNAAAAILAHNHPSGVAEPSRADELLTRSLKEALAVVDIKVLDHFVVGGRSYISFAERGLL